MLSRLVIELCVTCVLKYCKWIEIQLKKTGKNLQDIKVTNLCQL